MAVVTDQELRYYIRFYPDMTSSSVERAVESVKRKTGTLDAVTVDYYLRPKSQGGLGMGKFKTRVGVKTRATEDLSGLAGFRW